LPTRWCPVLKLVPKDPSGPRSPLGSLDPIWTAAVLMGLALTAWIITVVRMGGMDASPGTSLGSLGWFVGIWTPMMAAMMLPSLEPTVRVFARVAEQRKYVGRAGFAPTWLFGVGYLAVWTGYGLAAFGVHRLVSDANPDFLAWSRAGPLVAGGALIGAGLF